MRPGVTIPFAAKVTKVKDNKIGVKSVKMKKVSKSGGDVKMQMKRKSSIMTKGKPAKSMVKVKTVKKK